MGVEYVADPELILCQDFNTEGSFDHMCPRNTRHVRIGGRWLREQRTEAAFLGCIGQDLLRCILVQANASITTAPGAPCRAPSIPVLFSFRASPRPAGQTKLPRGRQKRNRRTPPYIN